MHEIKAIVRPDRLEEILDSLHAIAGLPGITVSTVTGYGRRQPATDGVPYGRVVMTKLEVVVPDTMLDDAVSRIRRAAFTGRAGDGKIFVIDVRQALSIRSEEQGVRAL